MKTKIQKERPNKILYLIKKENRVKRDAWCKVITI